VVSHKPGDGETLFQYVDNRPTAITQRMLQEMASNSLQVSKLRAFQDIADNSAQAKHVVQVQDMADAHSARKQQPTQKKENDTDLADNLKTGMGKPSGMPVDNGRVRDNSSNPARLNTPLLASYPHHQSITRSFGRYDVGGLNAIIDTGILQKSGAAAELSEQGAVFSQPPNIHMAAHEAAHEVQRRAGLAPGLQAEVHANAVADAVVAGRSSEALFDCLPRRNRPISGVYTYSLVRSGTVPWNYPDDLLLSDDGYIAVGAEKETQTLYADWVPLAESIVAMQKLGSPLVPTWGTKNLEFNHPENGEKRHLLEVSLSHTDTNTSTEDWNSTMLTREACNWNALNLMGLDKGAPQEKNAEYRWRNPEGEDIPYDHLSGMGADMPLNEHIRNEVIRTFTRKNPENQTRSDAKKAYRKHIGSPSRFTRLERNREAFMEKMGINEYAIPEVGDILEVVRHQKDSSAQFFPAHFAPVIMKSGHDAVTLENYARKSDKRGANDHPEASSQWFFRLLGPKTATEDQTFFGQTVEVPQEDRKKGTMVVRWERFKKNGQ
jgi:hypothetical protein